MINTILTIDNNQAELDKLKQIAKEIRKKVIQMAYLVKVGHVGSAYSMVELLAVLFFKIMRLDPKSPHDENRDRFILSKGHACAAYYAVLALRGFFEESILWEQYYFDGGLLHGHPCRNALPGIEVSTGSLGQGFAVGAGMALAGKKQNRSHRTFVILSDGECNEGMVWETAMFSSHNRLDNLIAIVDYNGLQAFGRTNEVMNLEPFAKKWEAFGWSVKEIDGHNLREIVEAFNWLPAEKEKPTVIIAKTIKGKGVSFLEDKLSGHYQQPTKEDLDKALIEIELL